MGYFNDAQTNISGYSPIIFDITLVSKNHADHDNDGLLSIYEDVNGNGDFWDDDTDNDGTPNFLDLDDDGDGYTTREEITFEIEEGGVMVEKLYPLIYSTKIVEANKWSTGTSKNPQWSIKIQHL